MSDRFSTVRYGEVDWLQSIEDDSESDIGSRSTSSTLSWTDDGEKEISEEMRHQYERFESALYSEVDGEKLPEPLLKEVAIWKQHSPHLRINGTQITPTYSEIEEKYPEDYEEVYAIHNDQDEFSNNFKEQCSVSENAEVISHISLKSNEVCQPFAKKEDNVLRTGIEDRSQSKLQSPIKENRSFRILEETLQIVEPPILRGERPSLSNRNCISRHECKCNHKIEREESTDQGLKPPSCRQRKLSPSKIYRRHPSSSYSASRAARMSTATSARLPKRKSLVPEFVPNISEITEKSDSVSVRYGILPPIQTLPITPKLPNKRANSAMLRFSKTFPRTRPNTSRYRAVFLTPIDDSDNSDKCSELDKGGEVLPQGDGHLSPIAPSLSYCSTSKQSKQLKIPRRWRY